MPIPKPPLDPILSKVLSSGGFESILRAAGGIGHGADIAGVVSRIAQGAGPEAQSWLTNAAIAAKKAGHAIDNLPENERLSSDLIPSIPSLSVVGSDIDDIVAIGHSTMPGYGPNGTDRGIDTEIILIHSPTREELLDLVSDIERSIWFQYDMGEISYLDAMDKVRSTRGIYRVSK